MGKWTEAAKKRAALINSAATMLTDEQASTVAALYPSMKFDGSLITAGTRINFNGEIKRAAVDLWDRPENAPDMAISLWSSIEYRDGARIIPDIIPSALAFDEDELGWWQGKIYKSTINANVWNPEDYPLGWELVDNAE